MGTPVPPDPPIFEDDKFYLCTVDAFETDPGDPPPTCNDLWVAEVRCCRRGDGLNGWDKECIGGAGNELCHLDFRSAQRLTCVQGPYDNLAACQADL